jgi:hypothetical protein
MRERHAPRGCVHNVTNAASTEALGLVCITSVSGGFFLVARSAEGSEVCTGGDAFRAWVNEAHSLRSRHSTFASAVDSERAPALYWVDTSGGTVLSGRNQYRVSVVLLDSQHRSLQHVEGQPPLRWVEAPARDWLRYRVCVSHGFVPLGDRMASRGDDGGIEVDADGPPTTHAEPQCAALSSRTSTALVALEASAGGYACAPHVCTGDADKAVVNTFRGPKDVPRSKQRFRHVLKPRGCRYHWYDENELARCLRGRAVLNSAVLTRTRSRTRPRPRPRTLPRTVRACAVGGSVANALQRGFERLSSRPKLNWWWDYSRTQVGLRAHTGLQQLPARQRTYVLAYLRADTGLQQLSARHWPHVL